MFLLLIVNANANELAITNKMTQEDLTNVIKNGFEKSYYCYGFDGNTKITTKAKSFPYLVISKEDEVAPWFKEKFKKNYYNSLCVSMLTNEHPSIDIPDEFDYSKNVYVTFSVSFAPSYLEKMTVYSDSVFVKEIPLVLNEADYSKIYSQVIKAISVLAEEPLLKPYVNSKFTSFQVMVSKREINSEVEYNLKNYKYRKLVDSWKPEFASQPGQATQTSSTLVDTTTQKPPEKSSAPSNAPDKAAAIQKAEQAKIVQAEIKKEVAVAQVENKAQLTQEKALPVVKKVDDDVQKALKKIPKKEKKKVELKPYLETVVVCTPPSERGSFKCYGPNGSFSGSPNQPKGYKTPEEVVTMNMKWSCTDQKRFVSVNNHSIWGCGFGATGSGSSKDSSQGLPIPERATYYCKPKQINCKNQSPTLVEN